MTVRDVEWKLPYTGWKAISIDENKVISLNLRDENNLIIYDEGDDEIYVDLQLPDWIRPLDAFPVGVTTGRVLVADDWDVTWTIVCFKTTSWDNIKLLYADDGKLYIDNWTWTFKQIYLKGEVDALLQALREYTDAQLALKQDKLTAWKGISIDNNNEISNTLPGPVVSSLAPLNPVEWDLWYDTTNDVLKIYDWTNWNVIGSDANCKVFDWYWTNNSSVPQDVYDWISSWKYAIVQVNNGANSWRGNVIFSPTNTTTWTITSWEYTHASQATGWLYYEEYNTLTMNVTDWVVTSVWEAWTVVHNNWHLIVKNNAAPNAIQWSAWYDTTNDVLKTYDWTNWNVVWFNPENSWTNGYLLTKTSTGYNWANKLTLPTSTATAWYVLKKSASSASSYSRAAPDMAISSQTGNLLLTTALLWIGTVADYQALSSYDMNTIYITV